MKSAEEMRAITAANYHVEIGAETAEVMQNIELAARQGKSSIRNPFANLKAGWPTLEKRDKLVHTFTAKGYKIVEHPDPDPSHPGGGSYTTLSWGQI